MQVQNIDSSDDRFDVEGGTDAEEMPLVLNDILWKTITVPMLLFDIITSVIGIVAFSTEIVECCGKSVNGNSQQRDAFLYISIGYIALVVIELYPVIFRRLLCLTILNPYLGFVLTAGLAMQSSRWEAIAVLSFEATALVLQWIAVKTGQEQCNWCRCCITIVPIIGVVIFLVGYLNDGGQCMVLEDENSTIWTISGGQNECFICEGDGLPFVLGEFREECLRPSSAGFGSDLWGENGDYCGNLTSIFCFYDY